MHHFSRFTDKGPSVVEKVERTLRSFFKEPIFPEGNADWISELPSVIKKYNNTVHSSKKMKPIDASKKLNEKIIYSNLQDRRDRQKPKFKLGQLVRIADINCVFNEGDSTKWSYKLYTITELIHDTILSNRINDLLER